MELKRILSQVACHSPVCLWWRNMQYAAFGPFERVCDKKLACESARRVLVLYRPYSWCDSGKFSNSGGVASESYTAVKPSGNSRLDALTFWG
jgi:hypothetical protein